MKLLKTLMAILLVMISSLSYAMFNDSDDFPGIGKRNQVFLDFNNDPKPRGIRNFHCRREMQNLLSIDDDFSALDKLIPLEEGLEVLKTHFSLRSHQKLTNEDEEIGSGAFGKVFKFYNEKLDRFDVIKLAYTSESFIRRSIKNEFAILKELDHPKIPKVYGYTNGPLTAVHMQYIEGTTLKEHITAFNKLEKNSFEYLDRKELLFSSYKQIEKVLEYLRSKNVRHGDVHAGNIIINNQGEAFLVDFGNAKFDYFTPGTHSRDIKFLKANYSFLLLPGQ